MELVLDFDVMREIMTDMMEENDEKSNSGSAFQTGY